MSAAKRWRVTQYTQPSELGTALFPHTKGRGPIKTEHRDFRWLWRARLCAAMNRGTSAGFGLNILTTEITDLTSV